MAIENNCTDLDQTSLSSLLYHLNLTSSTESKLSSSSSLNDDTNLLREWLHNETNHIELTNTTTTTSTESLFNDFIKFTDLNDINDNESSSSSLLSSLGKYCPSAWDGASCWMRTLAGNEAIIPCFSHFNGIKYDTSQNATRMCLPNGTWAERADYDQCKALNTAIPIPIENLHTTYIYYFGYGLSLLALSIALFIFLYFKDLRCVRNIIHTNLMATYLLIAICWITTDRLHAYPSPTSQKASCITVILLTYLMGTNFFWMFVEGLYLYILVVKTFSIEFVKITKYLIIGWAFPALIILCWLLTKFYFSNYDSELVQCPFQAQDEYDNIYKVPILVVLIINIFFLGKIMWVLITKLRSSNSIESKQRRKAAKALLVLIPLLGVGYMFVLVTPTHPTAKWIFQYSQAILVSTQGFTVAVLYCFCNGEVRNSLRNHFQRFRLRRTLRYGGEYPAHKTTYYRTTAYYNYHHHHKQHNQINQNRKLVINNNNNNNNIKSFKHSSANISGSTKIHHNQHNNNHHNHSQQNMRSRDSCISYTTTTSFLSPSSTTMAVTGSNGGGGLNGFGNSSGGGGHLSIASTTTTTELIESKECLKMSSSNNDDDDDVDDYDNVVTIDNGINKFDNDHSTTSITTLNDGYHPISTNDDHHDDDNNDDDNEFISDPMKIEMQPLNSQIISFNI
uniref:Diuretic hormone receptor n=1 Tax=Dermatophagoides pteronyssinus TaxID=6956 RepID=A0A6P6YDK2_DERPT|nr:diuretic hormone receptor-like [Dermatophagoides pteronyssinus]